MQNLVLWAFGVLPVVSYLLGAIPTAVWWSRAVYGQDIRKLGSQNAGSTNMYRVFGWRAGLPVQLIDIAKGAVAAALPLVWYALLMPNWRWGPDSLLWVGLQLLCGIAAVLGHLYPVFAGWKGGKGVNTILGMMLVLQPIASLIGVGVFVGLLLGTKMVSVGSMGAVSSFSAYRLVVQLTKTDPLSSDKLYLLVAILLTAGVFYTHRSNLKRIANGTERKAGFLTRKSADDASNQPMAK